MASKSKSRKHGKGSRGKAARNKQTSSAKKKIVDAASTKPNSAAKPSSVTKNKSAIPAGPTPEFASGQQLAKAIAEKSNLVEVGSKLLSENESKGASVRARMFETTVEYLYGKPANAAAPEAAQVVFVCDIPRPVREKLPE